MSEVKKILEAWDKEKADKEAAEQVKYVPAQVTAYGGGQNFMRQMAEARKMWEAMHQGTFEAAIHDEITWGAHDDAKASARTAEAIRNAERLARVEAELKAHAKTLGWSDELLTTHQFSNYVTASIALGEAVVRNDEILVGEYSRIVSKWYNELIRMHGDTAVPRFKATYKNMQEKAAERVRSIDHLREKEQRDRNRASWKSQKYRK
jgi:hypothetical protein